MAAPFTVKDALLCELRIARTERLMEAADIDAIGIALTAGLVSTPEAIVLSQPFVADPNAVEPVSAIYERLLAGAEHAGARPGKGSAS